MSRIGGTKARQTAQTWNRRSGGFFRTSAFLNTRIREMDHRGRFRQKATKARADALLLVGVELRCGPDVGMAEHLLSRKDALVGGEHRAKFLAQLVELLPRGDAMRFQPAVE